jgi:Per1-like family
MLLAAVFFFVSVFSVDFALASVGDRSDIFRSCLYNCFQTTCPSQALRVVSHENVDLREDSWSKQQPWYLKLLMWECEDECKYTCMWTVVDIFAKNNISVPQFYGKVSCQILHRIRLLDSIIIAQ